MTKRNDNSKLTKSSLDKFYINKLENTYVIKGGSSLDNENKDKSVGDGKVAFIRMSRSYN